MIFYLYAALSGELTNKGKNKQGVSLVLSIYFKKSLFKKLRDPELRNFVQVFAKWTSKFTQIISLGAT